MRNDWASVGFKLLRYKRLLACFREPYEDVPRQQEALLMEHGESEDELRHCLDAL
jgi:hypothetical protein